MHRLAINLDDVFLIKGPPITAQSQLQEHEGAARTSIKHIPLPGILSFHGIFAALSQAGKKVYSSRIHQQVATIRIYKPRAAQEMALAIRLRNFLSRVKLQDGASKSSRGARSVRFACRSTQAYPSGTPDPEGS